ncbi:MAG: D-alanyl-D-alanine carboxypeptidase family protein [Oscillospiraceae bacterium]
MKKYLLAACIAAISIALYGCSTKENDNENSYAFEHQQNSSLSDDFSAISEASVTDTSYDIQITENNNQDISVQDTTAENIPADVQPENNVQTQQEVLNSSAEQQPTVPDTPQPEQNTSAAENPVQPVQTQPETPAPPPSTDAEKTVSEPTYINGIIIANKTYALPADYNPGVNDEALKAFESMQKAAYAEGLNIYISSGFRSYDYQKQLYNRYVSRDGQQAADTYSARPGHSEHQTGLAFDLNTIELSFADTAEGKWVAENCNKYGFIIRYPADKVSITGYQYEPWHIRYLGTELATDVYNSGLCLEEYLGITSSYDDYEKLMAQQN